ncbi:MAG: xanthine dehydrogenase family protein molybdopterin-binding subunit, partial [Gammaproteobacteria bacterium]|nr:xanthine dehydrogenase family protein molybdopterin-binding subunit [Gammaproteobacteria bacterium]
MSESQDFKYIGQRTIRPDGFDKVTGRANFAADLALPGMIWGKILRSPHAHAKIVSIDTSKAEAHPDVFSVATHADFPASEGNVAAGESAINIKDLSRNILADDKVLYHGHAVAAVAARSERIAEEALALIDVKYELLPHVLDVEEAMKADAPLLHADLFTDGYEEKPDQPSNIAKRMEMKLGDVEAGFADADVIVEREFVTPRAH